MDIITRADRPRRRARPRLRGRRALGAFPAGVRRRAGRAGRGDAGARPAERPDAPPRPAAGPVAGRVQRARVRAAAARPARCRRRCASRRSAAAGASCTCAARWSSPGWSTGATSTSRCASTTARGGPTWWSTWSAAAAWWSTPRCRSTPTSTPRRPTTPDARDAHLARHARQLRTHVDALASKAYWRSLPETPEFVVLFVPAESFLAAALETDPGPARARRRPPGGAGHADHADRAAAHGRARLEPRGARRAGPRHPPARAATCTAGWPP